MKLYRWAGVEALLAPHGEVVDGAAAGEIAHVPDAPDIVGVPEVR